ncbi:MAG: hypothetical protein ACJAUL_000056 [Paraglaciecola sp.]|jgi:hypothetical protein
MAKFKQDFARHLKKNEFIDYSNQLPCIGKLNNKGAIIR